ncbi:MAG: AraC family transcriptional regulator [Cyclobacteriaceae bacterium]|jgi:AraC family transcriptional regulator
MTISRLQKNSLIKRTIMKPRIETLTKTNLIGINLQMSISNNRTGELWRTFMLKLKELEIDANQDKYSIQLYSPDHFKQFNSNNEFTKWAAIQSDGLTSASTGLDTFNLEESLYAIFDYKGLSSDPSIFQYIYADWLPKSEYLLDDRPHFEILGEKYKNNHPESEEEIWIPIKPK